MYVITREDLEPGYQGVQAIHAAIQFGMEHPEENKEWYHRSNYLAFLSVENEAALKELIMVAQEQNIVHSVFREPDIDNEITAIALEAGEKSKRLCSKLQLALKE